jgi:hypothetical protein
LIAIACFRNLESSLLKSFAQRPPEFPIVIHNQDPRKMRR